MCAHPGGEAYAQARGYDGVLVPLHVKAEGLATVVEGLKRMENLGGVIVTVPHKTAIAALCDDLSANARRIGAVNAVRREADGRLVGEMLDGAGFVRGLKVNGIDPAGLRAISPARRRGQCHRFCSGRGGRVRAHHRQPHARQSGGSESRLAEAYPTLPSPSAHRTPPAMTLW